MTKVEVVEKETQNIKEVGVALIRGSQSRKRIVSAYRSGNTNKELRSYMLPKYQRDIIDMLHEETGKSKADVVRTIIDEWVDLNTSENGER